MSIPQSGHADNGLDDDGLDVRVKMAPVHYQFEAIHPFPNGNRRTGRILITLYLVDHGLLNLSVLYLLANAINALQAL